MNTILTDDEIAELMMKTWGCASIAPRLAPKAIREAEAAVLAKLAQQEPVVEFMGRRRTPEGTRECWGVLLCDDMQDPAKGTKLYIHPPAMPSEVSRQWRAVMPGGKMTDKWESSRVADYNQGWNDYRRAALRNLESAAPQQADRQRVPDEDSPAVCDAYERIDRFLRNNLGDEDYADYSHDLDLLAAAPEAPAQGVPDAMKTVIAAMQSDPGYAWSWHCNVAMAFVDAGGDPYTANQGAARFMRVLANVEPAHELPAQASAVDEREAFEAWVNNYPIRPSGWTEACWNAWQARATLAQKGGAA